MGGYAVLKGTSYTLAVTPDMVLHNGTTQTTERTVNPKSEYLKELPHHLRSCDEAAAYLPNQVYIGNKTPEDLAAAEFPWYDKKCEGKREGRNGEIMPQDEFIGLIQICDVFDLVKLEKTFADETRKKLAAHPLIGAERAAILDKNQDTKEEINQLIEEEHAEPLYDRGELVGAVKRAHDIDTNLSAHVMLENLVSKASSVLSLLHLIRTTGIDAAEVEYVIDCCEEACGDMNQRGGGNFAKAAAETAGLFNATGSDSRGFCAGPAHALLNAASLVKAGTFKAVAVTAGGCTAKLGMNGKDHVKKKMPILEDVIAGFSVLITADDGCSPQIRTDIVGRHTVGTGSSPQAVIGSLVTMPLDKAGLKITDVDKFSPEMQNPDITKPAGAGDVPEANYKMIAALGVKRGEIERTQIADFVKAHGMTGWAPTQGHIPSGVPYLGFARDDIMAGKIQRAMIIGKGSLFLGRMTNLFDGISFVIETNDGKSILDTEEIDEPKKIAQASCGIADELKTGQFKKTPVIGIAAEGSEHSEENLFAAVRMAERKGIKTVLLQGENSHDEMEKLLESGDIDGAVTMHYPFPIGVSTVGKVITPAKGHTMYLATTTGTADTDRICAMVKNAVYGIITAKADGIDNPTVGIANIDGARQCEKALLRLKDGGYPITFARSSRADGGIVMRGNDLLQGNADVMVMDSLTGNLMVKIFSSYTTGGGYESFGWGYGPGIGEDFHKTILIISRASGAPLIAGAVEYAASLSNNQIHELAKLEFSKAKKAGLKTILKELAQSKAATAEEIVCVPPKEIVTEQIGGIEVMDLDEAVAALWKEKVYAESGMGCTGPIIRISEKNREKAIAVLTEKQFI